MVTAIDENTRRFSRLKFKILDDVSHLEELSKLVEAALTRECAALADKIEVQKADLSQEESEYLDGWHKMVRRESAHHNFRHFSGLSE